jgi:hypothetical protein
LGPGCDTVSSFSGGATGVNGLNALDSANIWYQDGFLGETTPINDVEPADQGLCAGNGYVIEDNNIGEILVFNAALHRESSPISLDSLMGLASKGWSSAGDISCLYDYNNGGHWFFTEIVSATPESTGGPFSVPPNTTGCFEGGAYACYEGIAVTVGSNPFGPYNVYFLNADYNPSEPGYPYFLNDFAKISTTQDAFLVFYDEFPLFCGGFGGGCFNGAQEFAFDKNALELGLPVTDHHGRPNRSFTVAIENMGLFPTPDGTCAADDIYGLPGITCWYQVIPAQPPDPSQYDNSNGGSGFMLGSLDFYGAGDNRIAIFDWTGLSNLNSKNCRTCSGIQFGGQLFSGVLTYYGEGQPGAQKSGPIPLGDAYTALGNICNYTSSGHPPYTCSEGGIATNGDGFTQVSQAQGQIWGAISTEINQRYSHEKGQSCPCTETHMGAVYWVIGTQSFDERGWGPHSFNGGGGAFSLTSQGYVSPEHEDLEFPAIAAEGYWYQDGGNGGAIMTFTLSGKDYYPSTAYGRLTSTSNGLLGSKIDIADLGESPQDGFTEYQPYPVAGFPPRFRWGDYSWAIYLPWSGGTIYFATNYIQSPNCSDAAFATDPTCGGTRAPNANWGTSVNFVVP